ncbi:MAG: peptide ABC transporter substrate-binding protein [Chlamydiia bacterium]|nr:peptide ABC transporter substrate-binding protein [Chlamydiia bacterium]
MHRFFFLFLFLLSACHAPIPKQAVLRLAFNASPTTLDPRKTSDFISSTLVCLLYDGLMRCAPGGSVEPAIAERVEISADGLLYTFYLREAYWSDGRPVTAYDFEYSWKKILDPAFSCPCAYLLFPIKHGEQCAKGEISPEEVKIQALNERALLVELERPTPYFLSLTAFPLYLPAPAHLEQETSLKPICNGPFQVSSLVPNQEIQLVKNSLFWNRKENHLDAIHISIIPNETTALQMFEQGEIDWMGAPLCPLPLDALSSLQDGFAVRFIPMAASTFCTFNTQIFPFYNFHLRKAFALAIDQNKLISEMALVGQIPAKRCLPPALLQTSVPLLPESNLQEAKASLQQALLELQIPLSELSTLTFYHKSNQVDKILAQALQRQWQETLGISLKLEQLDLKNHMDKLHRKDYHIALASWIAQFHDAINILERYRLPSNQKNFAGWHNEIYATLLEKASQTQDPTHRMSLLESAEEILAAECPILPLYHWTSPSLSNPRIDQIVTTPCGGVLFERFTLRDCR